MADFRLIVILDEQNKDNEAGALEERNNRSLHQSLLMLFDSPLNHASFLEIFIRLADGRIIKLHREVRIPRTFKRFDQLFSNFLQGCDMPVVQTKDGPARLLQFVGKSLDKQLPDESKRIRISNLAPKLRPVQELANETVEKNNKFAVFIDLEPIDFNILGEGREIEYDIKTIVKRSDEEVYSISRYPLSASLTCVKLTTAFERALEVF